MSKIFEEWLIRCGHLHKKLILRLLLTSLADFLCPISDLLISKCLRPN